MQNQIKTVMNRAQIIPLLLQFIQSYSCELAEYKTILFVCKIYVCAFQAEGML